MKNFNYQTELQSIIDEKRLVEVYLAGAPTQIVAYILAANDTYTTLAVVSSSAEFAGVTICQTADIDMISVETLYLQEFTKQLDSENLYQRATTVIENIAEFTFNGFLSSLEDTKTLVEITTTNEENMSGRIAGLDQRVVVFDEYSSESSARIGRTYINKEIIVRISLDAPWLRTIARSLADNNI